MWKCCFLSVISTSVAVGNSDLLFLPFVQFLFIILFSFIFPPTFFCTPNHFTSPLRTFFFITLSLPPLFFFIAYFSVQSETLHINPLHTLIPSTMCVSFGVMLPVGNPPNAIVFSYGHVQIRDMVRHTNTHSLSHNLLAPAESKRLPGTAYPIWGSFYFVLCGKQKLLMLTEVIFLLLISRSKQVLGWIWLAWRW